MRTTPGTPPWNWMSQRRSADASVIAAINDGVEIFKKNECSALSDIGFETCDRDASAIVRK